MLATAWANGAAMKTADEKEIAIAHLTWLTFYSSELSTVQQSGEQIGKVAQIMEQHRWVYGSLLHDALISGLYSLFEKAAQDQKTGKSQKITLEHFIYELPPDSAHRAAAEALLKAARSSSSYKQLCRARGDVIGHSNRQTLLALRNQPNDMFPAIGVSGLATLLSKAQKIAKIVIDPSAEFFIPGLHGVEDLFDLVRRAAARRV